MSEPQIAPEVFVTDALQYLVGVHNRSEECDAYGCAIHCPSDHDRKDLPLRWSVERQMMVRIAADGSWLTDPDEMAWRQRHPDHPYRELRFSWETGPRGWGPK